MLAGQAATWRQSASAAAALFVGLAIDEVAFEIKVVVDVGMDPGELLQ